MSTSPSPAPVPRTVFDPADPEVNAYKLLNSLVVARPPPRGYPGDAPGRGPPAPPAEVRPPREVAGVRTSLLPASS